MFYLKSTICFPVSDAAKGISLALVSTALFVLSGMIVRMLSGTVDSFQILLFRQMVISSTRWKMRSSD
ncbi:hypothetical protein [Vibrio sp. HN007]|uniref:hypothetical protein n=1 Tax=Vibrio iocasae TaxID=3098914 RepID=UPI0035D429B7